MKKQLALWMIIFSLVDLAPAAGAQEQGGNQKFQAAEITSASDISYPSGATSSGTLVFKVWVSANGAVEQVQVRRALEPFTGPSVEAIKNWKFRSATLAGKPVASGIIVAVTVNPRLELPPNVPLPPLLREEKANRPPSAFKPADVELAIFPQYPAGAVNPGTVVLESALDEKGTVESTKVVRELAPYTGKAIDAVTGWRFTPARLNTKPVISKIVLAFVFPTLPPPIRNDH